MSLQCHGNNNRCGKYSTTNTQKNQIHRQGESGGGCFVIRTDWAAEKAKNSRAELKNPIEITKKALCVLSIIHHFGCKRFSSLNNNKNQ